MRNGIACSVLPGLIVVALAARHLSAVLHGSLLDPDSYMRMVRLRETLAWRHPAYVVTADGSGHGTLIHWSHLLDGLVCLLATPLMPFLESSTALHCAAVLVGPLSMAALGFAVAWTAAPFADSQHLLWGSLLAAVSPAVAAYAVPGVLHHHVLIIVAAVMAGGYAARIIAGAAKPGAGLALGTWAAVGIWLTPEVTPLLLLIFGGIWLAWVGTPQRRDIAVAMLATGTTFLLTVTAAWAVDPPYAGYAVARIDRLSILFVALAAATLATGACAMLIDRATAAFTGRMPARVAAAIASGATCFAAWAACFPMVLHGTDGMISAADWHLMMDVVREMQPVQSLAPALDYLLAGTLAAWLLCWFAWHQRSLLLAYLAVCGIGLVVLGQIHVRFTTYSETLAAIMLPIVLSRLQHYAAVWRTHRLVAVRLATVAAFIALPPVGSALALSHEAHAAEGAGGKTCAVSGLAAMLAPYAGQVVLANVNQTPELLYRTPVLTVGSLYHRNVAAFLRLRAAWRSGPSNVVPPSVAATQATFVLFCPSDERSMLVSDLPRNTLLDRLNRGAVPPWLQQVAEDKTSGNILYWIVR